MDTSLQMNKPEITARMLGHYADNVFCREGQAVVLGVTSKGVFLQDETGGVCFISQEPFQGPLTMNIKEKVTLSQFLHPGEHCHISSGEIVFPKCRIVIPENAPIWEPVPIDMADMDVDQTKHRGHILAEQLIRDYEGGLFTEFLNDLHESESWGAAINTLLKLVPHSKAYDNFYKQLPAFLGLGTGLTPAGDDFICGLLLANYHLNQCPGMPVDYPDFLATIQSLAWKKTTSLSAALIGAAAEGQADERIIALLRWLLTGAGELGKIKEELLSYGSSSGVDSIAGMLAAVWSAANEGLIF